MALTPADATPTDINSERIEVSAAAAPLQGSCAVPGSKSFTNRALLLAGFAHGPSHLSGLLDSDDAFWALDVLHRLGIQTQAPSPGSSELIVHGCGGAPPCRSGTLHLGDAGTLARFLPGLLAAAPGGHWHVTASAQLARRPLAPLLEALQAMGGDISAAPSGGLPLVVRGQTLRGSQLRMAGDVSSQFISGALMAAAASGAACDIALTGHLVQPRYVDMTVQYLLQFGANIDPLPDASGWRVSSSRLEGQSLCVEADASSACYFWGAAAATAGNITVENVGSRTLQPDIKILAILERMGCKVSQYASRTSVTGPLRLRGGFEADLSDFSDQAPTLAALAALSDAPVRITGIGHIRHHESNRLDAMACALRAIGCSVDITQSGIQIIPGLRHAAMIDPRRDHRIAMAMTLVALKTPGVSIYSPDCVAKTCPTFFQILQTLGVQSRRVSG